MLLAYGRMETRSRKRLRHLQPAMHDIIGDPDPGLFVVARRVIDYLDYESLINASKTYLDCGGHNA